jgi:hypothetical protein
MGRMESERGIFRYLDEHEAVGPAANSRSLASTAARASGSPASAYVLEPVAPRGQLPALGFDGVRVAGLGVCA